MEQNLEELATQILQKDAKIRHTTLTKQGIIDDRRRKMIDKRELPLSVLEKER